MEFQNASGRPKVTFDGLYRQKGSGAYLMTLLKYCGNNKTIYRKTGKPEVLLIPKFELHLRVKSS